MSKHTPGPWLREGHTVYSLMHFGWRKGVEQFKNRFWASVYKDVEVSEEEREANAKLIEAVPDLLEACQLVNRLDPHKDSTTEWNAAFKKVAEAIRKATE